MARPAVLSIRIVGNAGGAQAAITATVKRLDTLSSAALRAGKALLALGALKAVAAVLLGLGAAVTNAAVALGAFGAAAAPQLLKVGQALQTYAQAQQQALTDSAAAAKTMAQYRAQLAAMPKATQETTKAAIGLRAAFAKWSDALAPTVMPLFTAGIKGLTAALPALTPLVKATAAALKPFVDRFKQAAESGALTRITKQIAAFGGPALTQVIRLLGNLGKAFATVFAALGTSGQTFITQLADMAKRFAEFTAATKDDPSRGLGQFARTAQTAGPALNGLILSLARLSPVITASTQAAVLLVNVFNTVVAAIPTPVIQALGTAILAVAVAIKGAQVAMTAYGAATAAWSAATTAAAAVQRAFTAASVGTRLGLLALAVQERATTAATIAMTVAQRAVAAATRVWAAVQWAMNAALSANPIGLVIIAVAALAAGIVIAYKRSSTFRAICTAAFNAVKVYVTALWKAVQTLVSWFRRIVVPAALGALRRQFDLIRRTVDTVTSAVRTLISWISRISLGALSKAKSLLSKIPGVGSLLSAPAPPPSAPAAPAAVMRTTVPALYTGRQIAANVGRLFGAPRALGAAAVVPIAVTIVLDGAPLTKLVKRTVVGAMDADGARLAAGGWA
ncbi:hypothetical protein AB0J38_00150 [Streptomyces sp. NPDC050095]|uniref:hypothetical protein n=1 Tax=unclassified Streptomyces TaxID=2593676 RepID=UPI00342267D1